MGLEFCDAWGYFISSQYSNAYTGSVVVTAGAPTGAATAYAVLYYNQAAGTVWLDGDVVGGAVFSPLRQDSVMGGW